MKTKPIAATEMDRPAVGIEVGAHRWPYEAAHPDAWGRPWKGTVLAIHDPRAWQDTMAFPGRLPSQEEVDAHIAPHTFGDRIPVLWDFGPRHGLKTMWERLGSVRPYADDLAAWEAHRATTIELMRARRAVWEVEEGARREADTAPPSHVRRVA